MTTEYQADQLIGYQAVDTSGAKVGKIGGVYLDDQTGQPAWLTVSTGLFGTKESFAPLYGATFGDDQVILAVSKDQVKDAPNVDADGHIDDDEQAALYQYYSGVFRDDSNWGGWPAGGTADRTATDQVTPDSGAASTDTASTDTASTDTVHITETAGRGVGDRTRVADHDADAAMTRSEERLDVGTERVQTGRARLRKYVVTENVTQTVPVSHEEVRLEREPITGTDVGAATGGPEITEAEHEVTLHAEQPVVSKEAVPVERVRLGTETVTGEETVDASVRKERVELEGDDDQLSESGRH